MCAANKVKACCTKISKMAGILVFHLYKLTCRLTCISFLRDDIHLKSVSAATTCISNQFPTTFMNNQFSTTRISSRRHELLLDDMNQFSTTRISYRRHESVLYDTNQFSTTRISSLRHESVLDDTNYFSTTRITSRRHESVHFQRQE